MTTIKASCPDCGSVELTRNDLDLQVCVEPHLSFYAFVCPECAVRVEKPADDHIVNLLISGGVEAKVWDIPAEAKEIHTGPALTYDDLLEFCLELGVKDYLSNQHLE